MRMTLMQAIAREEGYGRPGTRATRNHNPGNLEYGKFSVHHGASGADDRYAIFPDDATGQAAASALLMLRVGMTVAKAIEIWAPPNENNTPKYISNVCLWTGLTSTSIVVSPDTVW